MADPYFLPQKTSSFEGYYHNFKLPSGATLIFIYGTVPKAQQNAHSVTLVLLDTTGRVLCNNEELPPSLIFDVHDHGFTASWDGGEVIWAPTGSNSETFKCKVKTRDISFSAESMPFEGNRVPWQPGEPASTPAGILAAAPLPIHWHVHSVETQCSFELASEDIPIDARDKSGNTIAHLEKNWSLAFPPAYIWMQARNKEQKSGLCLAGGSLLPGLDAFLVGYQPPESLAQKVGNLLSYGPPVASQILGVSATMTSEIDYAKRSINLSIYGLRHRISISASADPSTFFNLSAPTRDGFAANYTTHSYAARMDIRLYRRRWPWQWMSSGVWEQIHRHDFDKAAIEFGGSHFKR